MHARSLVAGFLVVLGLSVSIPTAGSPVGAASTQEQSSDQCKDGGWHSLTDAHGQPFRNQGQCISYFIHNPVSLADLSGSFSGTTLRVYPPTSCGTEQPFDATYPGSPAVGSVILHIEVCGKEPIRQFFYTGTFTIATNVGTDSGNAAGQSDFPVNCCQPMGIELTLTVLLGTGAFAGTTGTIYVSMVQYFSHSPVLPITGSVTVPAGAYCEANAISANDGFLGDYFVNVTSNQPHQTATASDATDTNISLTIPNLPIGFYLVPLSNTSPGESISVTVGAASCSTTAQSQP